MSDAAPSLPTDLFQQVAAFASRYETGLRAGSPPSIKDLLDEVPPQARSALLRELLFVDVHHHQESGRPLTEAEARQRIAGLGDWAEEVLAGMNFEESTTFLTLDVVAGPHAGQSYQLAGHSTCLIGRGPTGVQLALDRDRGVSGVHFLIEYNPPRARLADLRSKNGTWLNGQKIDHTDLSDGDQIRAGQSTLKVKLPPVHGTVTVEPPECSVLPTVAPTTPIVAGYEILEELGRGGMGVVYKARRLADEQFVAVKMVSPATVPHPTALARFQRETAILRNLTHRHIVAFHEAGQAGGQLYFVMEYVDGPCAATLVKRHGPFVPARVVELGCQLLDALAHAHLKGFVHRDVKPGNLLLTRLDDREAVKLADFGLGRAYQASAMSGLTVAGTAGGTPAFMPPEQVLDFRTARPAADQYAAATLYYLLTGQTIYEPAPTTMGLMMRILNSEPIPLRQPGPPLPAKLSEVFRRALARDARHRFPDVLAMREALAWAL
jgi:pSer/pThr/pTyr-binding forkhead associated (FHA) protein